MYFCCYDDLCQGRTAIETLTTFKLIIIVLLLFDHLSIFVQFCSPNETGNFMVTVFYTIQFNSVKCIFATVTLCQGHTVLESLNPYHA